MSRAPFQVLVFPFKFDKQEILYCVLKRNNETGGYWQVIAGGGEENETELEAAKREALEEALIPPDCNFLKLNSMATIPVVNVSGFLWGPKLLVIPEYSFGVDVKNGSIKISTEHSDFKWLCYEEARKILKWDSNRNALWELNYRLTHNLDSE